MVGRNVDHIYRRDLYSAARPSRRNCLITIWCGSVSSSGNSCGNPEESHRYSRHLPAFFLFLRVDIQSAGHTMSRPWSQQPNDVMSEIGLVCAQLHNELIRHSDNTLHSHGLFALAKHLSYTNSGWWVMPPSMYMLSDLFCYKSEKGGSIPNASISLELRQFSRHKMPQRCRVMFIIVRKDDPSDAARTLVKNLAIRYCTTWYMIILWRY